jgi:FKBP-type peptidyl-prolyl cis-trans isomerase (trigger factor)
MYANFKITKSAKGTVTIEGELSHDELAKHRSHVISKLGRDIEIPGFRKGHVPEKMIVDRVGEGALLQEMAEHALSEHYPKMLAHHDIDAIGRPAVTITKLAPGNPLGFKIETAILPKLELPDYTALAKKHLEKSKKEEIVVTDDDISKFIETALRERNERKGEKDAPLPEMTDDLVKEFGAFKDIADFKTKIKDGILQDKKYKAREALRVAILNDITDHTKAVMPDILVEAELDKMYSQFMRDIERFGLKPAEYMEHIKKTEDDLRKEWRQDAEKSAKQQLILHDIGTIEKIEASPDEIKKETDHILSHHKDAKRENVEAYVATALANQKVIEFLENQA